MQSILIIGTGLIGASTGLALKAAGFTGKIIGFDASGQELAISLERGVVDHIVRSREEALRIAADVDVILLAVPVLAILDWMNLLAPITRENQIITDVGSTKAEITRLGNKLYNQPGTAQFVPGHPMAGKESGGAAIADGALFENAVWIFTGPGGDAWRTWVAKTGARLLDMEPARHDELTAWVSHLPQMVSTALSALLQDIFGEDEDLRAIGGRALREMTRLGSSPYSMWRDVALTNTEPLANALLALEQRLTHLRENLRTPGLRDEFTLANEFRLPPK